MIGSWQPTPHGPAHGPRPSRTSPGSAASTWPREGAAGLSVRAVARDLGVVSSAIYRYVRSRDDLLTLLVVDGYDELGDAVDAALAAVPATTTASGS